jgi:prepilin-type N-terminal cleavage/methylation domain-containing protein
MKMNRKTKFSLTPKRTQGFTLIEVVIVVAIIAIFVSLVPTTFRYAFQKGKDTTRKTDIKQYQIALENYANDNESFYPLFLSSVPASTSLCPTLSNYLATCPEDKKKPADSSYTYYYQSSSDRTRYVLWSKQDNGLKYWVVCSNKKAGEMTVSSFGSGPSSGTCPLP